MSEWQPQIIIQIYLYWILITNKVNFYIESQSSYDLMFSIIPSMQNIK